MAKSELSFLARAATCFGVGYLPKAPGTWGTLVAVPAALALGLVPPIIAMSTVLFLTIFALIACEKYERESGEHDAGAVVIDEFVGYLIAANWLPFTWQSFVGAFLLFRLLDITKPLFIGVMDRKIKGGIGVLADDVAAGIVANIILQVIYTQTTWLGSQAVHS